MVFKFLHELPLQCMSNMFTTNSQLTSTSQFPINYETSFVRSLQDRILSLERQRDQKQQIIKKLLEGKEHRPSPTDSNTPTGPAIVPDRPSNDNVSMGTDNDALPCNDERKLPIVYEDIAAHTGKQNSNSVKGGNKKKRSKQKHQAIHGDLNTSTDKRVGKTGWWTTGKRCIKF